MGKSDAGAAPAPSIPTTSTSARDPLHPSVSHSHHAARARGPSHHTAGPSSVASLPPPTSGPSHTSNPHHPRTTTTTITAMTDDLPHRWGSTSGSAAATPVTPAHSGDEEDTRGRIDARRSELSQLALVVCQQPERARLCSFKEENETIDRRPVDPPPVIELVSHAGDYPELLNSTSFFIRASLVSDKPAEGTAGHGTEYVAVKTPTGADATAGEVIQTPERLRHLDGKPGALCIFAKLSVRLPGTFRLKFTLYETGLEGITEITHTVSEPFEVFSPKLFKGMHESTPLTRHLATQGLKVKLRTDSSGGKAGAGRRRVASAAAGRDPGTQMRYQAGPGGVASSAPPTGHHPHRSTLVWGGYDEEPARKMRRIDERDREAELERARTRERERLRDDSTFAWGEMSSRLDISLPSSSADLSGYSLGHSRPNSRPQSASAAPSSYAHPEWDNNGSHPIPRNREYPFGDDGMPVWPKDRPEMPPHDFRHEMPPPPEVRESRDPRDVRDPREPRDPRDVRDPREFWDPLDPRDPRDPRDLRDARDPREPGDPRDPREQRDIRDPREPWDPRDPRLARDPRDGRAPWDPQNGDGPLPSGPQDRRGSQPIDRRDSLLSERRDSVSRDSLMREVRDVHSRDGSLAVRDIHSRDGLRDRHSRDGSMRDSPMRDVYSRDGSMRDSPMRDVYSRDGLRDVRDVRSRDGRDIHSRDGIRDTHSRDGRGDVLRDPRDPRSEWSPAPHMHGQPHPLPQQQPPDFAFPQPRLPRIVPTAPPRDPRDPRDPVRGPHTAHAYPSHSQAYDYPHEPHMPHSAPPHPHSHARRLSGPHPLGPPGPLPVHGGPPGPPGSSGGHPQHPQHPQHPPPPPHHPHHPQHAQHAQHAQHPHHQAPPHGQHAPPMHYDPYARRVLPPIRSPPRQYERDPRG